MRYFTLAIILTVGFIVITGCRKNRAKNLESNQPLSSNDEAPLLLEDEPLILGDNLVEPSGQYMADNSRCYVCHINYVNEDIAVTHARAKISCADCHGQSDSHIDDESWASGGKGTPPEIMYRRQEVNPFCSGCHEIVNNNGSHHKVLFDSEEGKDKNCTDCHGDHRLTSRRLKWK